MSVPLPTPSKNEQWNWAQMYKIPVDILDDLCRSVFNLFILLWFGMCPFFSFISVPTSLLKDMLHYFLFPYSVGLL